MKLEEGLHMTICHQQLQEYVIKHWILFKFHWHAKYVNTQKDICMQHHAAASPHNHTSGVCRKHLWQPPRRELGPDIRNSSPIFPYLPQDVAGGSCDLIVISNSNLHVLPLELWLGLFRFLFWRGKGPILPTFKRMLMEKLIWPLIQTCNPLLWTGQDVFVSLPRDVKHAKVCLLTPFWVIERVSEIVPRTLRITVPRRIVPYTKVSQSFKVGT